VKFLSSYVARRFIDLKYDEDTDMFGHPADDRDHRTASVTDRSHDQTIIEDRATRIKMAPVATQTESELDDSDNDLSAPEQPEEPAPEDLAGS
jgi:hypothetical protein